MEGVRAPRVDGLVCQTEAMGATVYYTATSADGFIADENNSLDWLFAVSPDTTDHFGRFFATIGAFAMGATTYQWVLDHEKLLDQPRTWHDWYGDVPAWVLTHRALPAIPDADITFVSGDVRPVHAAMRSAAGDRDIWVVGGGELAATFADHGLLDKVIAFVAPVFLGAGAPLFPRRITSSRLTLSSVEKVGEFACLTYDLRPSEPSA